MEYRVSPRRTTCTDGKEYVDGQRSRTGVWEAQPYTTTHTRHSEARAARAITAQPLGGRAARSSHPLHQRHKTHRAEIDAVKALAVAAYAHQLLITGGPHRQYQDARCG